MGDWGGSGAGPPASEVSAGARAAALQAQLDVYQSQQHAALEQIQSVLRDATQGHLPDASAYGHDLSVAESVAALMQLAGAREHVARLKGAAERVKQLERQIRAAHLHEQPDVEQLVGLAASAAEQYAACRAELGGLSSSVFPEQAVPPQLRGLEQQLGCRLQAAHDQLHEQLSSQIQRCLGQCGWPPPLVPSQPGAAGDPSPAAAGGEGVFSAAHADATSSLQRLMLALTRLQLASQGAEIAEAVKAADGSSGAPGAGAPNPPLLWLARELAAPLVAQLLSVFGPSSPGSPGALDQPELMLASVRRLALQNVGGVDFLQGVVQALELHRAYHVGVEFARALRDGVKALLCRHKLPEIAAAGSRELWLAWIDGLIAFEGSLAACGLLGCYWDAEDGADLPVMLLAGSTLTCLGQDPAWMDAWLDAESACAARSVEGILFSEQGWGPGQTLLLEDGRPAWQAELWPPRAAEEVMALVESQLSRLRFIPQPQAQEAYLEGVVGAVLNQAHGRVSRLLQQADVFSAITSYAWLPRVCSCICFCHFLEVALADMRDDAAVIVTRLRQGAAAQHGDGDGDGDAQQQQQQQQQLPGGRPPLANGDDAAGQRQQLESASSAAAARLRLLACPLADFGSCRREWVLKLGKAAAMGFMAHAAGYVSRGGLFKATSEALPSLAADGSLWSSAVVSGELQPALAWLAALLDSLSAALDKECFRGAWGAAAAAINRELFNNVACEAIFSAAGALQLAIDIHALAGVFSRFTPRPATHFRELNDAVKLLNLQQEQAEFIKQAVGAASRAPNAVEVLKSVGVYHLDPELADTVLALRMSHR